MKDLGTGSFGCVRLAKHIKSKTTVAIKMIKKSSAHQNQVYKELMDSELKVLEELDHPQITRVFSLLEDERYYYVVMELVSGGNLLDRILS
jgi:serine/threonine protein kinase